MQVEAAPLSAADFAVLMARSGPFEPSPRLAVAVSGGPDSMALALLAQDWVVALGGALLALTVDHRLRPESEAEALRVAGWMAEAGIAHRILVWDGDKPRSGVQASARDARHRLLSEACAETGILHLLLAHHQDDQAETLLLRLGRGSGVDGLAAMRVVTARSWGRLLRPLLSIPKARLEATLAARGQEWINDPGNLRTDQARGRLRSLMPLLEQAGLGPARLAATAARMDRARVALEGQVAEAAARWVDLDQGGFALCRREAFDLLPEDLALRLLARLLRAVGGEAYPPRLERLERLLDRIRNEAAPTGTLLGCRIEVREGGVLLCREAARMAPLVDLVPGRAVLWDGRISARLGVQGGPGLRFGGLGSGWREVAKALGRACPAVPAAARSGIPALWDREGVCAVPRLGYNRVGFALPPLFLDWAPTATLT